MARLKSNLRSLAILKFTTVRSTGTLPPMPKSCLTFRYLPIVKVIALIALQVAVTDAAEPDFKTQVAPLLAQHCVTCHRGTKAKAGLDLTTLSLVLRGGDSGPVIVQGKPDDSLLLERVANGSMPPENDGRALTKEEVALLAAWIKAGAK